MCVGWQPRPATCIHPWPLAPAPSSVLSQETWDAHLRARLRALTFATPPTQPTTALACLRALHSVQGRNSQQLQSQLHGSRLSLLRFLQQQLQRSLQAHVGGGGRRWGVDGVREGSNLLEAGQPQTLAAR